MYKRIVVLLFGIFVSCGSSATATVGIDIPKKGVSIFAQEEEKTDNTTLKKKSVFLAGMLSFAVPGVGNFYAGDKKGGRVHLVTHIGLGLAFLFFESQEGTFTVAGLAAEEFKEGIVLSIVANMATSVFTAVRAADRHNEKIQKLTFHPVIKKHGGFLLAQIRF